VSERVQIWLGVVLVGVLAVGAMVSTAAHATTTTNRLLSSQSRRDAVYSDAVYNCLAVEGHQLIRPADRVYVAEANLDSWVILTKVLGGWAHLQEHRTHATVAVVLVTLPPATKRSTVLRQTMVTIRTTPSGRVVMAGGVARGSCAT
jgi:hypothetical protein